MNIRILYRTMLAVGSALLVYALNYDISVESSMGRVVNLARRTHQFNVLVVGALLFISGIILYAVHKEKLGELLQALVHQPTSSGAASW